MPKGNVHKDSTGRRVVSYDWKPPAGFKGLVFRKFESKAADMSGMEEYYAGPMKKKKK
jgi:hypothetical protein